MLDTKPDTDFTLETFIRCTPEALWEALTRADHMAAYHFAASRAEGDAAEGAGTTFLREDGSVMLRQQVLDLVPGTRLETTFEPHFGASETTSRVSYAIAVEGPTCRLTCRHHDLPPEQDGVREGWARWAASLKSWLETGQPIKMG